MPIGGPPAQLDLAGGSWESESDSDTDSDFFINFDYNSDEELTTLVSRLSLQCTAIFDDLLA